MAFRISRTAGLLSLAATLLSNGVTGGPIMGWNTYDCYNGAAPESDVLNAAQYMADNLAQYGWNLIEIDGGWSNSIDGYGRQVPNTKLYPSSTVENGLLNISSQIHALGLKFGVWTIRGIPKLAVEQNLPIFNSTFTAKDAARLDTNCSWDADNLGVLPNEAGRAYYSSVAQWYSQQGIDVVKIDCMVSDHNGLYTDDFTTFASTMQRYNITISVSPGTSMNPANASYLIASNAPDGSGAFGGEVVRHYRTTNDMWDIWDDRGASYPTGVKSKLSALPQYAPLIGLNNVYPSLDMLPIGDTYHQNASGSGGGIYGPPSPTHLTQDEQITLMTLAFMARAPLLFGGLLPLSPSDTFTLSLLTNIETLLVHNASSNNTAVPCTDGNGNGQPDLHAWAAIPADGSEPALALDGQASYVALFNAQDSPSSVSVQLSDAFMMVSALTGHSGHSGEQSTVRRGAQADAAKPSHVQAPVLCVRDLWAHQTNPAGLQLNATTLTASSIPAHGAGLYMVYQNQENC